MEKPKAGRSFSVLAAVLGIKPVFPGRSVQPLVHPTNQPTNQPQHSSAPESVFTFIHTNSRTATPGSSSTKVSFMPGHELFFSFLVLVTKHLLFFFYYLRCSSSLPVGSDGLKRSVTLTPLGEQTHVFTVNTHSLFQSNSVLANSFLCVLNASWSSSIMAVTKNCMFCTSVMSFLLLNV